MDDVHGIEVTGGSFPAEIWRKFMREATADMDTGSFTVPTSFPGRELNPELQITTTTEEQQTTTTDPDATTTTEPGATTTTEGGEPTTTEPPEPPTTEEPPDPPPTTATTGLVPNNSG
jgi:membrane peptidoglycan carboxypeptidase